MRRSSPGPRTCQPVSGGSGEGDEGERGEGDGRGTAVAVGMRAAVGEIINWGSGVQALIPHPRRKKRRTCDASLKIVIMERLNGSILACGDIHEEQPLF